MPEFRRFDPAECHFPRPSVPLLPALQWRDLTFGTSDVTPADVLQGPGVRHFARGRYAMHAAYQASGLGPEGTLLAPAYHCRTMLDPALALKGNILLYGLNSDLTPQPESIRALVANSPIAVKALVVPHYFGFDQPQALMADLAAFCRQQNIMLIEDCSHAWQVAVKRATHCQAQSGHMLMASPYKFFACNDGGTLWGHPAELPASQAISPSLVPELGSIGNVLAKSWSQRRTATVLPPTGRIAAQSSHQGQNVEENSSSPSTMYDVSYENRSSFASSRWVMQHTKLRLVVKQRQQHYHRWTQALAGLRGCKALFPDLPPDCAPYMFPLQIDNPAQHFCQLKHLGLPIWRWDEMAVSDCNVSISYRLGLLHLPCHQSLSEKQLQWMIAAVTRVFK